MPIFQKHSFWKIFFLVIREAVSSQVSNASATSTSTSHPSSKRRTRVSLPEGSTRRAVILPGSSQAQGTLFSPRPSDGGPLYDLMMRTRSTHVLEENWWGGGVAKGAQFPAPEEVRR